MSHLMMSRCCVGSAVPLIIHHLDSIRRRVDRLLEIRADPPEGLGRTPGPKAILSYVSRDETLKERQLRLPKSTRTIHRLLRENGRIPSHLPTVTEPLERPAPIQQWQLDFKEASSVPSEPQGKKQQGGETLNVIDKGTSVLVAHQVRSDFTAETAVAAVAQPFAEHGFPSSITLDRDTQLRWERLKAVTFPLPWCAFVTLSESRCSSAIRIIPHKRAWWNAITVHSLRNA